MSSFTAPLEVRQVGGSTWAILREMTYYAGHLGSDEAYTVPYGFVTDFASIPRVFWTLIGHPAMDYAQAAVLHDYLYTVRVTTRQRADGLFLEAMGVLGVPTWKAWVLYAAVRSAGWIFWR